MDIEELVIADEGLVSGTHQGSVIVLDGGHLRLVGTLQGSVSVEAGGRVSVLGVLQGSMSVAPGGHVEIVGRQQGSVSIDRGATVEVQPSGALQGSVSVEGTLVNRGVRGGSLSGRGQVRDEPGSTVVQPEIRADGTHVYIWSD